MTKPTYKKIVASTIADAIVRRIQSGAIAKGHRVIVSGFHKDVLLAASERLAHLAAHAANAADLSPDYVAFVRPETEAEYVASHQSSHASRQVCSSFCVNLRDSGNTAVFFVTRDMEAFVDESLGAKGSVWLSSFRGASTPALYSRALRQALADQGYEGARLGEAQELVEKRIAHLMRNEEGEVLAYALLERFLCLPGTTDACAPEACKALCMAPFSEDNPPSVETNLKEIDRLRQSLADPKARKTYAEQHRAFDADRWSSLLAHIRAFRGRVPLEEETDLLPQFFDGWPEDCDLDFLLCRRGRKVGRISIRLLLSSSDDDLPRIPDTRIHFLREDRFVAAWTMSANLQGANAQLIIDGRDAGRVVLDARRQEVDVSEVPLDPARLVQVSVVPDAPSVQLTQRDTSRAALVYLPGFHKYIVLVIGNRDLAAFDDEHPTRTVEKGVKGGLEYSLAAFYLDAHAPPVSQPRVFVDGEETDTVYLGEGEEATIEIRSGVPGVRDAEVILHGSESDEEEPEAPKLVDTLLDAICDARRCSELRDAAPPLELFTKTRGGEITVCCQSLPDWERRYQPRETWLGELATEILAHPETYVPRSIRLSKGRIIVSEQAVDSSDGTPWPYDGIPKSAGFEAARRKLFNSLLRAAREGAGPLFIELAAFEDPVRQYVNQYRSLLEQLLQHDRYAAEYSLVSLVDCFLVDESVGTAATSFTESDVSNGTYVLAPTHPLRLLWLLEREKSVRRLVNNSSPGIASATVSLLDGAGYPDILALPNGVTVRHTGCVLGGYGAFYQPEIKDISLATARLVQAVRALGLASGDVNPLLPTAPKLLTAMDYVHRLLPYRQELRMFYENPGSGNHIVDACKGLPRKPIGRDLHGRLFCSSRLGILIDLLQDDSGLPGRAFRSAAAENDAHGGSEALPPKLEVRVPRGEDAVASGRYDIGFPDTTLERSGDRVLPLARCPRSLPCQSLLSPLVRRGDYRQDGVGQLQIGRAFPPPAPADQNESLTALAHLYHVAFGNPSPGALYDRDAVRGYSFGCDRGIVGRIRGHQDKCAFLFSLDTGVEIGMFDQLALHGENLIIDFDPNFYNPVARAVSHAGREQRLSHNFIITTRLRSVVLSRLASVAGELLGEEPQSDACIQAARLLSTTLNGISGRYLREVLQGVSDIKEAVACALSCRFLENVWQHTRQASSTAGPAALPLVIPLDDHWSRIRQLAVEPGLTLETDQHADIMILTVLSDSNQVQIWPRFVEVKYRTDGQIPGDAYEQVANSWRAFCGWQSLSPASIDSGSCLFLPQALCPDEILLRSVDLAAVMEVAIDRTARFFPGFGDPRAASADATEKIKNQIMTHVYEGRCQFCFDILPNSLASIEDLPAGEEIVAGDVLVVGPFEDEDAQPAQQGLRPAVRTLRLGRPTARDLVGATQ